MTFAIGPIGLVRATEWAVAGAAGLAGAWASYDFGVQLGGPLMGVVAALNGAAMCSLLVGALSDRLRPRRRG
jgi:hypothetical protein